MDHQGFSCTFPSTTASMSPNWRRLLEDRGCGSLYVPEHTHIPLSRKTPFPGGGELPKRYAHTHDPFVALAFAAAATKKLKIGTGICLVPQHDPIVTAKAIASLDMLSNGRFVFGIGGGWNVDEMENHGATHKDRFKIMREHVLAMKALWTQEEASFHGEFVQFDPVLSYPKPTQRPHPPIVLGGESDHTLKRVVEYCDGWFPRTRAGFDPVEAKARLAKAAEARKAAIPSRSRSPCSARRPRPRPWRATPRPASRARCSRCPTARATRSWPSSTSRRRSPGSLRERRDRPRADGLPLQDGGGLLALGRSLRGGRRRFALADRPRLVEQSSRSWNA